ncbi:MAG: tripartite tricarboxylate transporter substrate binding protein [Rubrivivax sp.]|nr:tripartite tricarboxylate transporter substrate binding protein [Rubrivivax sp.]
MNRRHTLRRGLALAALAAAGAFATTAVCAQGGAPLRLVVPFAAGTTTDIVSRLVGEAMGGALAQNVVVENKPGAGGTVGSDLVAKAAPDGATLLMGTVGTHAINPTLYRKLPYDALRDFVPVGFVGYTPTLLVVAAGSPLKTLADVKAQAAKTGGLTFASAGNGTSGHLAGELLGARLGGQMVHVPYNQGGQALTDVMSAQVGYMFYHPAAVLPHMKSGKLRAIGASSARRSAAAPDVPALQELGVADFDLVAWFMLYAPARTPEPVMTKLRDALQKALARPDVAAKLGELGIEARTLAPAELTAFAQAEVQRWAEGVKRSGAQVD